MEESAAACSLCFFGRPWPTFATVTHIYITDCGRLRHIPRGRSLADDCRVLVSYIVILRAEICDFRRKFLNSCACLCLQWRQSRHPLPHRQLSHPWRPQTVFSLYIVRYAHLSVCPSAFLCVCRLQRTWHVILHSFVTGCSIMSRYFSVFLISFCISLRRYENSWWHSYYHSELKSSCIKKLSLLNYVQLRFPTSDILYV